MIKHKLEERTQKFFANRSPRHDEIKLTLNNVYIFFSRDGLLFPFLLLVTFITGINYGNNLVLGLCFYLVSIWLVTVHITFSHVSGLSLRLLDVNMAEVGKSAWVTVEINNTASQPSRQLLLYFDHSEYLEYFQLPKGYSKHDFHDKISSKIPTLQGKHTVRLPVMTNKRGQLQLPRLTIKSIYPLGIMQAWAYAYFATPVWVYPKPREFEWQQLHTFTSDEDSSYSQFQRKGQDDFDTLDDYQQGEPLSRVSWTHVARGHGMLSKHFVDNVGRELTLDYASMPAVTHEQKLSQLCYALKVFTEHEQPFIMNLPNDTGKLGQGDAFIQANLLRLAQTP